MRRLLLLLVFAVGLAVPMVAFAEGTPTTTTTTTTATEPGTSAEAICKAEYAELGADAFKAKYGATEAFGTCLAQHGATHVTTTTTEPHTTTVTPPTGDDPASLCKAEYLRLGPDAFKAKYGNEAYGNCLAQHGVTTTTVTTTPKPPEPSAGGGDVAKLLCTAEGAKLGKDAFTAKYGPKEPFGNCLKAQLPAAQAIVAACKASAKDSKDAFKSCATAAIGSTRRR